MLRQFTVRLNQNANFHLASHNTTAPQTGKETFLLATLNEDAFDLQQLPRDAIGIKTVPGGAQRNFRVLFEFQTDLVSRPPTYILQSSLNL